MKTYTLFLFALLFLWSCSSEDPIVETPEPVEDTGEIQLKGNFRAGGINVGTRGDGPVTGTKPALTFDMYRADATSGTTYTGVNYTQLFASMAATSGTISWTNPTPQQYWLTDPTKYTKLIGLYPTGGTFNATNRTVTYALDGAMDIISSELIQGSRANTTAVAMPFKHLLTQVKVSVIGSNTNVPAKWGTVTKVVIKNKKGTCVVTLPAATTATSPAVTASAAALSGTLSDLTVTTAAGVPITAGTTAIPTGSTAATFGYAMFPTCNEKLTLEITTSLGGTQTKVMTNAQNFVAGTAYEIKINFTLTNIALTATVTDWLPGTTITENL